MKQEDYKQISIIIKEGSNQITADNRFLPKSFIINKLANYFEKQDEAFNKEQFIKECDFK